MFYKYFFKIIVAMLVLFLVGCDANEVSEKPLDESVISEASLVNLHNANQKKWKVTSYYSNYNAEFLDEEITNCVKDETYTFSSDNQEATVVLGDTNCYENTQNIESEVAVASYDYNLDTKSLYLTFTRGYNSKINKVTSVTIITQKCILLTEDIMIFASDNNGVGIVFEAVE